MISMFEALWWLGDLNRFAAAWAAHQPSWALYNDSDAHLLSQTSLKLAASTTQCPKFHTHLEETPQVMLGNLWQGLHKQRHV